MLYSLVLHETVW